MKKHILILSFLFLLPLLSFGQTLELNYHSKKIRKEIKKLVKEIGKKNEIHTEAIGFGAIKSDQYKRFEKLIRKATLEEIVELTNHPKPVLRGYAFWALAKRHYEDLDKIYIRHANDGEMVYLFEGCMAGDFPLISFMRMVITPQVLDSDCKKLKEETMKRMEEKQYIFDKYKN